MIRKFYDLELNYSKGSSIKSTKEDAINNLIRILEVDTNKIYDGYHTFEQLYEHRIVLWIAFLKSLGLTADPDKIVWASTKHSDGSAWDGWFLLGMATTKGKQITYHIPAKYWSQVCEFAEILEQAPEFDGHTSEDVLKRIASL